MMTKDEALKIRQILDNPDLSNNERMWEVSLLIDEALEQPTVAELNDEYLRDTYVQGLSQPAQEPVQYDKVDAWLVPHILDVHGARRTSLPEHLHDTFHGTVSWSAEIFTDMDYAEDKHGVKHYPIPLYARPAQEPVAWMNDIAYSDEIDNLPANRGEIIPLYANPATSWQGLSDGELSELLVSKGETSIKYLDFARAIEQALKEKNHD